PHPSLPSWLRQASTPRILIGRTLQLGALHLDSLLNSLANFVKRRLRKLSIIFPFEHHVPRFFPLPPALRQIQFQVRNRDVVRFRVSESQRRAIDCPPRAFQLQKRPNG